MWRNHQIYYYNFLKISLKFVHNFLSYLLEVRQTPTFPNLSRQCYKNKSKQNKKDNPVTDAALFNSKNKQKK